MHVLFQKATPEKMLFSCLKSKYICYRMQKASSYFLMSPGSCYSRVVHRPAASASASILAQGRISGPTWDLPNLHLDFNKTSRCISNIKT